MVSTRGEIARSEVAEVMTTDLWHLFPNTTAYWRYRTFQRMLTEQGAQAYQNSTIDFVPELF